MYITEIFKIVVYSAKTSYVDPRIFFDRQKASDYATEIAKEGFWEEMKVDRVIIYREVPDPELGWFRTAGMSYAIH